MGTTTTGQKRKHINNNNNETNNNNANKRPNVTAVPPGTNPNSYYFEPEMLDARDPYKDFLEQNGLLSAYDLRPNLLFLVFLNTVTVRMFPRHTELKAFAHTWSREHRERVVSAQRPDSRMQDQVAKQRTPGGKLLYEVIIASIKEQDPEARVITHVNAVHAGYLLLKKIYMVLKSSGRTHRLPGPVAAAIERVGRTQVSSKQLKLLRQRSMELMKKPGVYQWARRYTGGENASGTAASIGFRLPFDITVYRTFDMVWPDKDSPYGFIFKLPRQWHDCDGKTPACSYVHTMPNGKTMRIDTKDSGFYPTSLDIQIPALLPKSDVFVTAILVPKGTRVFYIGSHSSIAQEEVLVFSPWYTSAQNGGPRRKAPSLWFGALKVDLEYGRASPTDASALPSGPEVARVRDKSHLAHGYF